MKHLTLTTCITAAMLATSAYAATPADTLVIGKAADPQTIDPGVTIDNNDFTIAYPAYQRLVAYDVKDGKGQTTVSGQLAESWTVSPDGKVWEFKLKPGNVFSDGSPVDAEAVRFSFERLMTLAQGPSEAFPAGLAVEAVDPMTVRFTLPDPFTPFLYTLANGGAAIVNPKVMEHEKDGDLGRGWLSANTAGSGAYMLANWEKGQSIKLVPNPHYGGEAPALASVEVRIVPDASARRLALEAGDLDIAESLPVDQTAALEGVNGVEVQTNPSLLVTYLYMNNAKSPFDSVEARKALIAAVDKDAIIEGIMMGQAKPLNGPIPEGMWGYDASIPAAEYDPAAAKAAFADLGLSGKTVTFALSEQDAAWPMIALAVQANLAAAGVNVKLESSANASYRDRLGAGDFDIAIGNWSPDFADPYMFMNYWFDSTKKGLSGNRSFYSNPKVDELVRTAATTTEQPEREALYQEAQKIVVDEAAYNYLFQRSSQLAMRDNVKGYVFNPMLENIYDFAAMSKTQ
ncbi:ABC transporter substrate-binding protein [Paenirhodobacter populi]|uniref:ABC transporter substrate-binding protein n=1 Tax=Paenirhodobacter populi TaxID=2306993 RepID=UPI000FE3BFD0|nr:ABC transporter substrate-binding protein [Sinirhodobacter populi]RWR06213.1 ABC transporter substrate-binding protein [Sinirhodobacter populi]